MALLVIRSSKRLALFPTTVVRIPATYKADTNNLLAERVRMA